MIFLIKLIASLAFIVFVVDFIRSDNKVKFWCEIWNHKWVTNDGSTFCLRCMENKATYVSQQRKKLLEAKIAKRKQERKAKYE